MTEVNMFTQAGLYEIESMIYSNSNSCGHDGSLSETSQALDLSMKHSKRCVFDFAGRLGCGEETRQGYPVEATSSMLSESRMYSTTSSSNTPVTFSPWNMFPNISTSEHLPGSTKWNTTHKINHLGAILQQNFSQALVTNPRTFEQSVFAHSTEKADSGSLLTSTPFAISPSQHNGPESSHHDLCQNKIYWATETSQLHNTEAFRQSYDASVNLGLQSRLLRTCEFENSKHVPTHHQQKQESKWVHPSMQSSSLQQKRQYRKARVYFQPEHMQFLEEFFKQSPYLCTKDREMLSQKLNLSEERIRTWFQNRRMREKRNPEKFRQNRSTCNRDILMTAKSKQ
ncbi:hypothetical protein EG68_01035 [Paragonimus skrjabini miyazakii]|uniref:Homeobox domain-containing protein n=1 Tax=Paragonimus skrjabini miyazakii TaxID=59628 RepID=A0A8S9Z8I6_9TREM|nr:hypothetical protein EG68_01035 [Paragonimus skrjabini miyazakii]